MITLIFGSKGSGKTKRIIDTANQAVADAKGTVIYITDKLKHSKELNYNIRFIDSSEYGIDSVPVLVGFVKGILASDNDIEKVFIDGLARIANKEIEKLRPVYKELSALGAKDNVEFICTASCEQLPSYLKKFKQIKAEA